MWTKDHSVKTVMQWMFFCILLEVLIVIDCMKYGMFLWIFLHLLKKFLELELSFCAVWALDWERKPF